eukprot:403334086
MRVQLLKLRMWNSDQKQQEVVVLVEDIIDPYHFEDYEKADDGKFKNSNFQDEIYNKSSFKNNRARDKSGGIPFGDEQGGQAYHDRLRKIFSKRLYRGPKTPPRRIQTDQISNSLLLDLQHPDHQSQEACSVFIPEESNPSILYTTSKKFLTEMSKMFDGGMSGQVQNFLGPISDSKNNNLNNDDEDSADEAQDVSYSNGFKKKRRKKSSNHNQNQPNLLAKIKSEAILPRQKRRPEKSQKKHQNLGNTMKQLEELKNMEDGNSVLGGQNNMNNDFNKTLNQQRSTNKFDKMNNLVNNPKKRPRRKTLNRAPQGSGTHHQNNNVVGGAVTSPKKSQRNPKHQIQHINSNTMNNNVMRSGTVIQGIGMMTGGANQTNQILNSILNQSQQYEESNTLGLSMDSQQNYFNQDQNLISNSINSSHLLLNKKVKTVGNISRSRIGKHKNILSKKAVVMTAQKQKRQAAQSQQSYWNLFIQEKSNYQQYYKTIKKLGQGGCGEVFMVMHLATDQIRAMKIINKNSDKVVSTVFDEINFLKQLDHPNIVQIYEYFQDDKNIYIIMEYLRGGSLFDRLKAINRFGEREAAFIMKQLLQALNYCFQKNIVHRDMKLENILFTQEDSLQIKIIDFGSAVFVDNQTQNLNRIVTAYYVAPEIINKEENIMKCDVWSCGVILFILLSGQAPFRGKDENEILDRVLKAQVNFEENQWKTVSSRAKILIKQMLEINVKNRLNLVQCISSPWIKMLTKIDGSFRIDMHHIAKTIKQLEAFQPGCKLRILTLHFSMKYFTFESHIDKFSKFYSYMDTRHVANMNERDLLKFAQRINKEEDLEILLQSLKKLVAKLDFGGSGGITFSEFMVAMMEVNKMISSQKLIKIFNQMDVDGDNYITIKDLYLFSGKKLEINQCQKMLEEAFEFLNLSPIPNKVSNNQLAQSVAGQSSQNNNNDLNGMKINFSNFKQIILNQNPNQNKQQENFMYNVPMPSNTGNI